MKLKSNNTKAHLSLLIALASLCMVVLCFKVGFIINNDCKSYLLAWDYLQSGHIDRGRTPIYPCLLGLLQEVFGSTSINYLAGGGVEIVGNGKTVFTALIIVQHLAFIASLCLFYRIALRMSHSTKISFWITLCYLVYVTVEQWNNRILTESLSLSALIGWIYCMMQTHDKPSIQSTLGALFVTLFLIFLRPAFSYLPLIQLAFSLWLVWRQKSHTLAIANIGASTLAVVIMLVYVVAFHSQYGIYSPTSIGVTNQYVIARYNGILDPKYTNDTALRHAVQESIRTHGWAYQVPDTAIYDVYQEAWQIEREYDLHTMQQLITQSYRAHPTATIMAAVKRFYKTAQLPIALYGPPIIVVVQRLLSIDIALLYILLALYGWTLCLDIKHQRSDRWLKSLIWLTATLGIFTAIIGSQSAHVRLIAPTVPLCLMLLANLIGRWGKPTPHTMIINN